MNSETRKGLSIIVPVFNERQSIFLLVSKLALIMARTAMPYEIVFVDDNSVDGTHELVNELAESYPINYVKRRGQKGRAESLRRGFMHAKFDTISILDVDMVYSLETLPSMTELLSVSDIVIAKRMSARRGFINRLSASLHGFDCDVQSGFKVFKREIVKRINLKAKGWAFDLEFLVKARNAGYIISEKEIWRENSKRRKFQITDVRTLFEILKSAIVLKFQRPEIVNFLPSKIQDKGMGFNYKGKEFIHHSELSENQTAFHRLSRWQVIVLFLLLVSISAGLALNWHLGIVIFVSVLTVLYFGDLLFNLLLVSKSFTKDNEITVSSAEIAWYHDEWPIYTVFCPLYKEWQVVPQFVEAISKLDYPKDKLQVMFLLEEDDVETIKGIQSFNLPSYFETVIVPDSFPKTKPKACNYGLKFTKGEYVVIYDAEDKPDPLQLKKAVLAFKKSDDRTVCIQAKLNFYNPYQNILTRAFTAEYSLWFDLVLTGLQVVNAPIPLGGTSNHFKTQDIIALKGWDSFNVTEDADLGMRLAKAGYRTAIVDSTTLEEANSGFRNWFWQRTRWIKGYMQTYLIHMRNPFEFSKSLSEPHILTFQLVIGGKVLSMFINPLMWGLTILYFLFRAHIGTEIESFFPAPIFYMGMLSLTLGNFLYVYYYMIGCIKHGHYELVKFACLVPLYWLFMSVAAWVALYKLFTAPHHWSKTKHGLHLKNEEITLETLNNSSRNYKHKIFFKPRFSF